MLLHGEPPSCGYYHFEPNKSLLTAEKVRKICVGKADPIIEKILEYIDAAILLAVNRNDSSVRIGAWEPKGLVSCLSSLDGNSFRAITDSLHKRGFTHKIISSGSWVLEITW